MQVIILRVGLYEQLCHKCLVGPSGGSHSANGIVVECTDFHKSKQLDDCSSGEITGTNVWNQLWSRVMDWLASVVVMSTWPHELCSRDSCGRAVVTQTHSCLFPNVNNVLVFNKNSACS